MKVKKIEWILLGLGLGLAVLGVALFFIVPLIAGAGFAYSSTGVLAEALKTLVSFNFGSMGFVLLFVLLLAIIIFEIVWISAICVRKEPRHLIPALGMLVAGVVILIILSSYFVVSTTLVEGGEQGKLISLIMKSSNRTGKLLSVLAVSLIYASIICLLLYSFIDVITLFGKKEEKEKEQVVEQPVTIEEIVKEQVAEEEVVQQNPLEGYEDRKAREEAFFKSCLSTGDFEQYDEVDLQNPIESVEEEPIFELTELEEEDETIQHHNYVQIRTERRVSVK